MRLFGRKTKAKSLLSEEDRKRTDEIVQELEKKNFDKASQLASVCIEAHTSPFAEAHFNEMAANVVVKQYGAKLPLAEYDRAKKHMRRSLEIYELIEKDERIELLLATNYAKIASLAQMVGKPEDGLKECQEAIRIFQKYGQVEAARRAQRTVYFLRLRKLTNEIQDKIGFFDENNPAKDRLKGDPHLKALIEELEKLKREAASI